MLNWWVRNTLKTLALSLTFILTCCVRPGKYPAQLPSATLSLHADKTFTDTERKWLSESSDRLRDESRGLINITYTYDVDDDNFVEHAEKGDDMLFRIMSDSPIVEETSPCCLLGLTIRPTPGSPLTETRIFLVSDRLETHDLFVSVTMHEELHALGLAHTEDPRSLMYKSTGPAATTCMHEADVVELCRVYGCKPASIGWCG